MPAAPLTRRTLSTISHLDSGGHDLLSLYLDLDPLEFPHVRDRHMQADSLLRDAEHQHLEVGEPPHAERIALREDLQRVRAFLTDEQLAPQSAHGLAIFCSGPAGIFEVLELPRSVEPTAVVAERAFIEPLAEMLAPERWCALLVNRRASRVFYGTRERLREVAEVLDDVHKHHAQGGWSQAGYQRGVEQEVDEHLRRTCELLYERVRRRPFERLLIGGPEELHSRVERHLRPELRPRLAGRFEIDVERATPDEVRRRALPLIEDCERAREDEALARLREGMAPADHAASGLDEVLAMLDQRRVATLLVAHGARLPGCSCPVCGRLTSSGVTCPLDGAALEKHEDILESTIEAALAQDAEVLVLRYRAEELAPFGSVAALLRF